MIREEKEIMAELDALKDQIEKAEKVLAEAKQNYAAHPGEYSARLLLMSIENHLGDLLRQLEKAIQEKKQ